MRRLQTLLGVLALSFGLMAAGTLMGGATAFTADVRADVLAQNATPTPAQEEEATPVPEEEATPAPAEEAAPAEDNSASPAEESSAQDLIVEIPFLQDWLSSPHADRTAEAFVHWNEEDPAEVPARCAKCHTTSGYQDYLGADGTAYRTVESAHAVGQVIACVACHNPVASTLVSVTFPSGVEIAHLGSSARCMECHQGRASAVDVATAIEEVGLTDEPDTVSADLSFINIHYYAAAASLYGGEVMGGFQYPGKRYDPKFDHVEGFDSCTDCHSPHTLQVKVDQCVICHDGVQNTEDLRSIRMPGSLKDYDGDGDTEEGIFDEIEGLRAMLYQAIQAYASTISETPIVYDSHSHPYFFADTNANGETDESEVVSDNRFAAWTPRLLEAAYNYQTSLKDPGSFAHNAKYHIQLLYDSIESLNGALAEPVDLSTAHRNDAGHFDATAEAFVHFREDNPVSANCTKCHTATGLPVFLENGVTINQPHSSSLKCTTCHNSLQEFTLPAVAEVKMPSGATVSFGEDASNMCLNCHQGRESGFSINAAIIRAGVGDNEVSEALRFLNPHYFAAGATVFGAEANGAYQYNGKEYAGHFEHVNRYDTCVECHTAHQLEVQVQECADCHDFTQLTDIREPEDEDNPIDFDGDGIVAEGLGDEITTIHEQLLAALQTYAADVAGVPIVYAPANHPYWYVDANENGVIDADELVQEGRYANWTPTLLRAAYNYQYVAKDPGAFTHNGKYILQVLYDSLEAIGGADAVAGMTRPE